MNRRGFLRTLLMSSAAAATLDIEKLLWVPKSQIVVPAMPLSVLGRWYSDGLTFEMLEAAYERMRDSVSHPYVMIGSAAQFRELVKLDPSLYTVLRAQKAPYRASASRFAPGGVRSPRRISSD